MCVHPYLKEGALWYLNGIEWDMFVIVFMGFLWDLTGRISHSMVPSTWKSPTKSWFLWGCLILGMGLLSSGRKITMFNR